MRILKGSYLAKLPDGIGKGGYGIDRAPECYLKCMQLVALIMNIEQVILTHVQALPPDKKQEVLDFIEFLEQKNEIVPQSLSPQQRARKWQELMENQPLDTPGLPEAAMHRDTMYEE